VTDRETDRQTAYCIAKADERKNEMTNRGEVTLKTIIQKISVATYVIFKNSRFFLFLKSNNFIAFKNFSLLFFIIFTFYVYFVGLLKKQLNKCKHFFVPGNN